LFHSYIEAILFIQAGWIIDNIPCHQALCQQRWIRRKKVKTVDVTMPKSLYQNWQFAIEVNGFDVALFRKGQEPKTEFEEVAFSPAGSMFDQKVAGRMKFDDITLEKGVLADGSDEAARNWVKLQANVNRSIGALPEDYMRDIDIVRYDRTGKETRRWTLHGAWVKTLEYDELEGGNTDNTIEKITLCFQYWS
jgi:phage tail-like protein